MTPEQTLDTFIDELQTREGKSLALGMAVENGVIKNPQYQERAIQAFIDLKRDSRAAYLARRIDHPRTVELLLSSGHASAAADFLLRKGELEKSIDLLANNKRPSDAADTALKFGLYDRGINLLKQAGRDKEAGDLEYSLKIYSEASLSYEKVGLLRMSYRAAKKAKDGERITSLERKLHESRRIILPTNLSELRIWLKYQRLRIGSKLRIDYGIGFTRIKSSPAEQAAKRGFYGLAGQMAESDRQEAVAGDYYKKAGDLAKAREMYERSEDYIALAELDLLEEKIADAVNNFERVGAFLRASEACKISGDSNREKFYKDTYMFVNGKGGMSRFFDKDRASTGARIGIEIFPILILQSGKEFFNQYNNPRMLWHNIITGNYKTMPHASETIENISTILHEGNGGILYSFLAYSILDLAFPRMTDKIKIPIAATIVNLPLAIQNSGLVGGDELNYLGIAASVSGSVLYFCMDRLARRISNAFIRFGYRYK